MASIKDVCIYLYMQRSGKYGIPKFDYCIFFLFKKSTIIEIIINGHFCIPLIKMKLGSLELILL